jgi:hypothetical protein
LGGLEDHALVRYNGRMRRAKLTAPLAGLNLVLVAVVLWQAHLLRERAGGSAPPATAEGGKEVVTPSSSSGPPQEEAVGRLGSGGPANVTGKASAPALVQTHASASVTNATRLDWRQVETPDYRTYVQNLRAIGCPEQTIRDIVSADVLQALAARRAEVLAAHYQEFNYWKSDPTQTAARAQLATQRSAVDEEMTALLHQLLGPDFTPPPTSYEWRVAELDQQLGFLPSDKRGQIKSVLLQYAETDQQIRALASNQNLTENLDERRGIIEAYEKEQTQLASLLTPEELEQVRLATSWTAENLRRAMVHFQPTENEFRLIFREWLAHDQKLARLHALAEPDPGNLQDQVFASLRETLGEERYREYRSAWWK